MKRPRPSLSKIFLTFLRIGAFTFGGGYAMLPLIRETVVEREEWVSEERFLDVIGLTQSVPGALAVNSAIFIGWQLAGVPGALVAAAGAILPSFFIILAVAAFFSRFSQHPLIGKAFMGIRPAVLGLITYAVVLLGKKVILNGFTLVVAGGALILAYCFGLNPFFIIIAAAIAGFLYSFSPSGGDRL